MRITFQLADGYDHSITVDECRIVNNEILFDDTDFIAMKFWSIDDIKERLQSQGYEPSMENVRKVINTGELGALEDATERDWDTIDWAIEDAKIEKEAE